MAFGSRRQQYLPNIQRIGNFVAIGNGICLVADTTTGGISVQFPTLPDGSFATDVLVVNASATIDAFIQFANDAAPTVAIPISGTPANGIIVPARNSWVLDKCFAQWVSGITATSTATLYLYQGAGS